MVSEDEKAAKYREQQEQNTRQRASLLGLPYADSRLLANEPLVPNILTNEEMYKNNLVPIRDEGENGSLVIGITINTPQQTLRSLREKFIDRNVQFVMISNPGFKDYMKRYDPPKEVHYEDVTLSTKGDSETLAEVSKTLESVRSEDIFEYLVEQAMNLNASDIHLENAREYVRVRFRVDGTLHLVAQISKAKYRTLMGEVASRGDVSVDFPEAQTGHISQEVRLPSGEVKYLNMRIETVPTGFGQDAVLRLFDIDPAMLQLDSLQLSAFQRKNIDSIIAHPHGLALVVGPTGSGKSTTLYSIINALNDPQRKIVTLEDPIEYSIDGVTQIPVSTAQGDSFANKLRAVLRIDPDVIMVGEIRDVDTARTAMQASVTGHLVLSTFHADNAAAALSRMIDMIGPNPIFASSIKMVIGQRLVRKLDESSRQEYEPNDQIKQYIKSALANLPETIEKPDLENIKLYRAKPSKDSPFGFKGRMVLMEQMIVSETLQSLIRQDFQVMDASLVERVAIEQGMLTMLQDGLLKALKGETTIEEIFRVL